MLAYTCKCVFLNWIQSKTFKKNYRTLSPRVENLVVYLAVGVRSSMYIFFQELIYTLSICKAECIFRGFPSVSDFCTTWGTIKLTATACFCSECTDRIEFVLYSNSCSKSILETYQVPTFKSEASLSLAHLPTMTTAQTQIFEVYIIQRCNFVDKKLCDKLFHRALHQLNFTGSLSSASTQRSNYV